MLLYRNIIKPTADRSVALLALLVSLPITLVVAGLLFFYNAGKPFFFQLRPGLNQRIFRIVKFKTMTDARDENGNLRPDADRLTWVGAWVRKTSVDELPQLWNVLRGDMSLVGPRPLLVEYLEHYDLRQRTRHNVRPGITGWAQVNGRNAISWQQKFEYDAWYIENQSFGLDLKILWITVLKVLKSDGINSATAATVEKFVGN